MAVKTVLVSRRGCWAGKVSSLRNAWWCVLLVVLGLPTFADELGLDRFEHFTSRDGLSEDWILDLYQDRQGFLWVGTDDGLNRFDGYRFKVYRHDPRDPRSLSDNYVNCVYQDRTGDLWVGTQRGLNRLDDARDDFSRYFPQDRHAESQGVYAIAEDDRGNLWVATAEGAFRFDPVSQAFRAVHHDPDGGDSSSDGDVTLLLQSRAGALWLGTSDGTLHRLEDDGESFSRYSLHEEGTTSGGVSAIAEDAKGRLWVGTDVGDVFGFDPKTGRRTHHRSSTSGVSPINSVLPRPDGTLWFGTELQGLLILDPKTGHSSVHLHVPSDPGSPSDNRVMDLLEDRTGVIWSGMGIGLDKLDPSRLQFSHYRHRRSDESRKDGNNLSGDIVSTIYEDREGKLWVGTAGGLDRLDREQGLKVRYPLMPEDPSSPRDVYAVLEDSGGTLWFGTTQGIFRLDRDTDQVIRFDPMPVEPSPEIEGWIYTMVEAVPGVFWVARNNGLERLDTRTRRLVRFEHDPQQPSGLGSGAVYDLLWEQEGMWIGGGEFGLSWLANRDGLEVEHDPENLVLQHFRNDPSDPASLSDDRVGVIHRDRAGRLWVGTFGGGLNRLVVEDGDLSRARFRHYRENDGLANDSVLAILEDNSGNLWLSSHRGLTRFDPESGQCKRYDYGDGLQSNSFLFHVAGRTAAGEMMFGGPFGFNTFLPELLRDDPHAPQVAMTEFRLFNRPTPFAERSVGGSAGQGSSKPRLTLTHHDRIFGFEFSALHFAKPSKNRYRYRLSGFSEDWVETDADNRFAQYTDLDAGKYRFQVQAANADGLWGEEASVAITVQPPPWKTWWAYSLYALALAALVVAFVRSQQRKVEREREIARVERDAARRERTVSRRLREVDKLKDEFLANTSHELRTPLYGITGLAESLIDGATGELPEETKAHLSMIVGSGRRLGRLVNDILDHSKIVHGSLELSRQPVDLRSLVDVVLTLQRQLTGGKELELQNAVPADLPAADADEARLEQILHNLVGNAVKFTEEGRVTVSATAEGDRLAVVVEDTGIGIAREQQDLIFGAFQQADSGIQRTFGGTGLGLTVTRQLVELHGGEIGVESNPGDGARFTLTLPVSRQDAEVTAVYSVPALVSEPSAASPAAEGVATGGAEASGSGAGSILVVDDEPINLQVLSNHLASAGYEVTPAANGPRALQLLAERSFDLVLLDVMMPKMSGYEVCRSLRERHTLEELPVIFLTAKNQIPDLVAGLTAGGNDYLTKPLAKAELLARVRTHFDLLDGHRNLASLVDAKVSQIKVLQGLLPICASCKKIRDDEGYWNELELFIDAHSEAQFSHSICPGCLEQVYKRNPELRPGCPR